MTALGASPPPMCVCGHRFHIGLCDCIQADGYCCGICYCPDGELDDDR